MAEKPHKDLITLKDILASKFLVLHEAVEISVLKKKGIPISHQTIKKYYPQVYKAHLTATEYEFQYALLQKDKAWIRLRLKHAEGWLEDPLLPKEIAPKCKSFIKKYHALFGQKKGA